jgi:FkbM family methyltransferase
MSFVSYAQNFEDVILWRALKHIEHGFYIDVGAWSPDLDSVTRAFYERGWRGVNIEPNPEFSGQLQARRPHDRNLRVAVGDCEGVLTMNFLDNPGLSTLNDAIAETHIQAGWNLERQNVQVTTLSSIWQQCVPTGQDVHFLKIDVEGFEEAALRGNDWSQYRPWIVVVEATLPMSQVESYESWEPSLIGANYRFAYADGLNRFYVAQEHPELFPAFKYPPNVFDDFLLSQQQNAEARAASAEARAASAEAGAASAEARAASAQSALETVHKELNEVQQAKQDYWQQAEARHQQIQELLNSTSWRVTAPLRWASSAVLGSGPNLFKARAKMLLQHAALRISRHPRLKNAALKVLNRFPGPKLLLSRIITGTAALPTQPQNVSLDVAHLSPRARQIYEDLKAAIELRQKENG